MIEGAYVKTPEGQVHYLTDGKGEPLLLLHQGPRSSRMYVDMIPILAKQYRVIALDMLGFGNSAPLPPNGGVEALAGNVVHVLDALRIKRCHLFGLHLGAGIAGEAAAAAPERIATLLLFGYPLVESDAERETYFAIREKALPVGTNISPDGSDLVQIWLRAYSDVLRLWQHTVKMPSEELHPYPLMPFHAWMTEKHFRFLDRWVLDCLHSKGDIRQIAAAIWSFNSKPRLSLIQAPTLHIEADSPYENFLCLRGKRLTQIIPRCEAVVLPGSDDNAAEFLPNELCEMIGGFLRKHPL